MNAMPAVGICRRPETRRTCTRHVCSALVALLLTAHAVDAQGVPHQPGYKDPATAQFLGLLGPGWGQLYVGGDAEQYGWYAWTLGYGGLALGSSLATPASCDRNGYCTAANTQPLYWGLGWYIGATLGAMSNAGDDARRNNLKRGLATRSIAPLIRRDRFGRTDVGLNFAF